MMNQSLGLKKMSINPAGVIGTKELLKGGIVEDATSQHSDRKEFYLNFEEMAAYHLQNEEEQNITSEVRLITELHYILIVIDYIALFLATFGVSLSIVINEIKYLRPLDAMNENILLMYVAVSSILLSISHWYRY